MMQETKLSVFASSNKMMPCHPESSCLKTKFFQFSKVTGIKAFNFAAVSKTLVERYFWLILFFVCLSFTIYDVGRNIAEYRRFPTAAKATIQSNQSLNFTGPMFCLEFFTSDLNFGGLDLSKHHEVFKFLENQPDIMQVLETGLKRYRNGTSKTLDKSVEAVISLVTAVIINVVRAQNHVYSPIVYYNYTWGLIERSKGETQLFLISNESDTFATVAYFLSKKGISPSSLIPIVGEILCWKIDFQVDYSRFYENSTHRIKRCSREMVAWIGTMPFQPSRYSLLCLRLNEEDFDFDTSDDATSISFYHNGLEAPNVTDKTSYYYVAFTDGPVIFPRSQALFYYQNGKHVDVNIHLHGVLNNLNSPQNPCGTKSGDTCRFRCRNEYIQAQCGCNPISLQTPKQKGLIDCGVYETNRDLQEIIQLEYVNIPGIFNCSAIQQRQFPNEECNLKCSKNCENLMMTYQVTPKEDYLRGNLIYTRAKIYVENFDYPLLQEFPLMGIKDFIAQLGGTLSFYLGANFIVVLHAVIYWIQTPYRK